MPEPTNQLTLFTLSFIQNVDSVRVFQLRTQFSTMRAMGVTGYPLNYFKDYLGTIQGKGTFP